MSEPGTTFIGPLAGKLGIQPATLRKWEDAGLVHPRRDPLIAQVRSAGGLEPLEAALHDWHARLSARGRAMLAGAAELHAYLHAYLDERK